MITTRFTSSIEIESSDKTESVKSLSIVI